MTIRLVADRGDKEMKILLPTDGSAYSDAAIQALIHRPWPEDTEVRIISVANAIPETWDPLLVGSALHIDSLNEERRIAERNVADAAKKVASGASLLKVSTQVLEGSPKAAIIKDAEEWGADLIMLGSHGYGAAMRFLLGSVAQAIVLHAPCSVELVRAPKVKAVSQDDRLPA